MKMKATVTLGDCLCGEPKLHKKFYSDGKALHRHGFFSVETGREQLDELIGAGVIDPADRDRLMTELDASGLPATRDEAKANSVASEYGFLNRAAFEEVLARIVAAEKISATMVEKICERRRTMTDDEKVASGVRLLGNKNLDDPKFQELMAKDIESGLLDRIMAGAKTYQEEFFASAIGGRAVGDLP